MFHRIKNVIKVSLWKKSCEFSQTIRIGPKIGRTDEMNKR